jgi:prepilin-type N-terminal cleavage/methylation domain-containing protein
MRRRQRNQDGFTCIEIMVPILILGLLATIVVQSLRGPADKGKTHQGTGRSSRD